MRGDGVVRGVAGENGTENVHLGGGADVEDGEGECGVAVSDRTTGVEVCKDCQNGLKECM